MILRFADDGSESLPELLRVAVATMSDKTGFMHGTAGRSPDDPRQWVLAVRWATVGLMRHGLGAFDVKMALGPLQSFNVAGGGVFEAVISADANGVHVGQSARAADADVAGPGSA